ncbi:hypothetical protein U5N28_06015 [Lysinibacillus telephonicus]|uniref:Uncharacterized protein n=1 Tax=Lysinibacillus telephonicus TaxID=1714840 RepID=A0A3S0QV73_9BACI|nr:hypothetical protein [Lysinibacillus telephonicus]RTQ92644.1 hypothetical protein EKG35_11405 [Lysinibacillus telephonicus]
MIHCENCHSISCSCGKLNGGLFGSPFLCKKQKRTRRFASPTSGLPQEELDELQECIELANDLLRSLGSERDEGNKRQLQLHFLNMKGMVVKANILPFPLADSQELINNHKKSIYKIGRIATAGRDFIQINSVGSAIFILYDQLLSIARADNYEEEYPEDDLLDVDFYTRRELAFNFGEYVSKNPNLINLFFGLSLFLKLKQFLGKDVKVKTFEKFYSGTLTCVEEGTITIKNKSEEKKINLNEVCYIEVINLK